MNLYLQWQLAKYYVQQKGQIKHKSQLSVIKGNYIQNQYTLKLSADKLSITFLS